MRTFICALLVMAWAGGASAQAPAFDAPAWKGVQAGRPTEVLTLGSFHLSQAAVAVDEKMTTAVLDKLAAFRPDIITVENVSGEQCDLLRRYAGTYPDSYKTWCRAPDLGQKAIGLDGPTAAAEIHKTLLAWPAQPSPAARRRLAALFLAAGEFPSAVLQWRRLAPEERRVGDGVTVETLPLLARVGAKPNETYDIGVALAVRLGLDRIYMIDDHTSDGVDIDEGQAYGDAIQAAWKAAPSPAAPREQALEAKIKTPADLLAYYRFLNQPDTLRQHIKADFGAALGQATPELYGRRYIGGWEVRNLRMVANIRAAFDLKPGARVLNIVGASHKPYFDAYLDMSPEVKLVDAEAVLN